MVSDATPAYRGYRLQLLYTLWRILATKETYLDNCIFQLEKQEDLDILDQTLQLLEVIQVKAHMAEPLILAHFKPDKPDSFFHRVASLSETHPSLKASIVSFGEVGPELYGALNGDEAKRRMVVEKLSFDLSLSEEDALNVLKKVHLIRVKEEDLTEEVFTAIRQMPLAIDPENAFDNLNFWLFQSAEKKCILKRQNILEKLNAIGKFLAERATHHKEWFTSITPLEDRSIEQRRNRLTDEFFRGVSAKYDHILAGLDVLRPHKLHGIVQKFVNHNIVIIHGASGQGKSTLAYRYLYEYIPNYWRYQVKVIDGREHALSIARALSGHARALELPLMIYIDVSPGDIGWLVLVEQLASEDNIY